MMIKIISYVLCLYILYLYLREILFEYRIELPMVNSIDIIDQILLLSGGLILGIVLLNIKGKFNKYLGIGMILINLVLTPIMLARALV